MLLKAQERLEVKASSFLAAGAIHLLELDMRSAEQHFQPHSFHAVWACATVLHFPDEDMSPLLASLLTMLKLGGVILRVGPSETSLGYRR
jgi:hypothetical protein